MENQNKLLLKAISNQVVKAISELCHLYFYSKAQQDSERLQFYVPQKSRAMFLKFFFLLTSSSNIYKYIFLKTHYFLVIFGISK